MSSGLQTITEMTPAAKPDTKSMNWRFLGGVEATAWSDIVTKSTNALLLSMYDSFWLGASLTLLVRLGTFKILRWPSYSCMFVSTQLLSLWSLS